MNMWLESIAQLQRRPSIETVLIGDLFVCNECGAEKSAAGFYDRMERNGTTRRSKVCKECELKKKRKANSRFSKPKPMTVDDMVIGALSSGPMIVSDLVAAVGCHRRQVDKAIIRLMSDDKIELKGFEILKYHPRVMRYGLTNQL